MLSRSQIPYLNRPINASCRKSLMGLPFLSAKPAKNDLQTGDQTPNLGDRLSDCLGGPVEIQDQSGP